MRLILISLLVFSLLFAEDSASNIRLVDSNVEPWCPTVVRRQEEVDRAIEQIHNTRYSDDKLIVLQTFLKRSPLGFSPAQVVNLLHEFVFSNDKIAAMKMMDNWVFGFYCKDAISILKEYTFSGDKLNVLTQLNHLIMDCENNQTIVDQAFVFASDKQQAAETLKMCRQRSCVYGDVTAPKVAFVVDVSGSMAYTFVAQGKTRTRLFYVGEQLTGVVSGQLTPLQMFNVFQFNTAVYAWRPGLQQATPANVSSAVAYIKALRADGGTNIYDAVMAAFRMENIKAIYLLTDGVPNTGVTDPQTIIDRIKRESESHGGVPVHTVCMLAGGSETPVERQKSRALMEGLAKATGAVFRNLE